jgi:restriction system protein
MDRKSKMNFKLREKSLFAILLRSPWWISFLVAAGIGLVARTALPEKFSAYAWFSGGPFLIIGFIAAWQQWRRPSQADTSKILHALTGMSWPAFAAAVEDSYRREGFEVSRFAGGGADFDISKAGSRRLVTCKRWKAARQGIEPLRELRTAAEASGIRDCIYLTVGEVTDNARVFAAANDIDLVQGARLAQLLRSATTATTATTAAKVKSAGR